jgi:hypothetical protein
MGGPAFRNACWQTTAASVAPAESPPTMSLVASMPSEAACSDTHRKFVFRREAVAYRYKVTSAHVCERGTDAVMGFDAAGDHAAAMEEDEARQRRPGDA